MFCYQEIQAVMEGIIISHFYDYFSRAVSRGEITTGINAIWKDCPSTLQIKINKCDTRSRSTREILAEGQTRFIG